MGYKNGFLKSAYKVAAFIASIILAYILYPYIKDFIVGSAFGDMVRSIVQTKYVEPKIASETLTATALPEYMRSMVATGQTALNDASTSFITNLVLNLISFLSVFIITRILISIIGKVVNIVSRLPVIRFFDRAVGVVFGIIEGVIIIYLVLALVYAITPLRENENTQKYISESTLTKAMYENNPIVQLVTPTDYDNLSSK